MDRNNLRKITELRHELHRHPELSGQERETCLRLQEFLRKNTSLRIEDRGEWFYAVKEAESERIGSVADAGSSAGSNAFSSTGTDAISSTSNAADSVAIAFRADIDALPIEESADFRAAGSSGSSYASENPGVSHKCGHDGHMAALCGLALELDRRPVERPVYLIFQPAEETGAGAVLCKDLIREKGIGRIYAFHNLSGYPEGSVVYRRGLTQPASEGLTIRLLGETSHAAAPEEGKNPATALAELVLHARSVSKVRDGMAEDSDGLAEVSDKLAEVRRSLTLCTLVGLKCGEGDFGISAGSGEVSFTLRAEEEPVLEAMEKELLACAAELAGRDGLQLSYEIRDRFPETRNHDDALRDVLKAAQEAGFPTVAMENMWRASEDFGHYLKECPGAMFYLGNGEDWPPLHTKDYDFNDRILPAAVEMFLRLVH